MGNGERSGSGRRNDLPVLIGGMVGGAAAAAVALFVLRPLGLPPLWLRPFAFCALFVVGVVLGRFVGGRLFHPPASDMPATSEDRPRQPGPPP